jgi:hypothetical protein
VRRGLLSFEKIQHIDFEIGTSQFIITFSRFKSIQILTHVLQTSVCFFNQSQMYAFTSCHFYFSDHELLAGKKA